MDDSIARAPFPDPETGAIIGAGIAVHKLLGRGFLEPVYRAALAIEFARRQIPFEHEVHLPVSYDGIPRPCCYRVDFVCYESVLVEVKALSALTLRERSQILNYLRASNLQRGLLLNFGTGTLQTQRLVWGLEDDRLQGRETIAEGTEPQKGP
jgi:GxxExxY protein